jgi:hypothetical protein
MELMSLSTRWYGTIDFCMGIKWIYIKDSSFGIQLERQIQHNQLNNINSLIMFYVQF